jgi:hypothetical protein
MSVSSVSCLTAMQHDTLVASSRCSAIRDFIFPDSFDVEQRSFNGPVFHRLLHAGSVVQDQGASGVLEWKLSNIFVRGSSRRYSALDSISLVLRV